MNMPTLFTIFHAGKETTLNGLRQYVVGRRDTFVFGRVSDFPVFYVLKAIENNIEYKLAASLQLFITADVNKIIDKHEAIHTMS